METWVGQDIGTTEPQAQLRLLNLSTAEWALHSFPPNIVALNGSLDDSSNFDNEILVIPYAGQTQLGSQPYAPVVYGIISGIAILLGSAWLFLNRHTMLGPSGHKSNSNSQDHELGRNAHPPSSLLGRQTSTRTRVTSRVTAATELGDVTGSPVTNFADMGLECTSAELFHQLILGLYYEPVKTELELYEKRSGVDEIETEDVEAVMGLARRKLAYDLELWGHRNTQGFPDEERNKIRRNMTAVEGELKRLAGDWKNYRGWERDERAELTNIMESLELGEDSGREEDRYAPRHHTPYPVEAWQNDQLHHDSWSNIEDREHRANSYDRSMGYDRGSRQGRSQASDYGFRSEYYQGDHSGRVSSRARSYYGPGNFR